ncbi:putative bifunctional diguanylate cyclase/phosphodiesterase [Plastoroseomonas hellenica]|nr:EAL domain-containing protein [Plastoroseomonas hellenica]
MAEVIKSLIAFMTVPDGKPELLKAQYRAFSRQLPLMYLILISNTWIVAATHMAVAPTWLTTGVPAIMTLGCGVRAVHWLRVRSAEPTPEQARQALTRTNYLSSIIAVAFTAWSLMLFPYGDAYTKSHVVFYMAITVIACIFSLLHLRSAAITGTVIVNGAIVAFFASTGEPTFVATAINTGLVSSGMLAILLINYRDFTRMIDAQVEAARKAKEQHRLLRMIDDMPIAVMTLDPATFVINFANETAKRTLGTIEGLLPVKADQLVGTCVDVFHANPQHQRRILADPANLPHHARVAVGQEVVDLQVAPIHDDDGSYIGPMLSLSIVTQQVAAERRIRQLAHYDVLTGLPNRATFRDRLEASLARPESRGGLLLIDLDGFKMVNDLRGHLVGDELLRQVAGRLQAARSRAELIVGRLGGDEFAILVEDEEVGGAAALATELIAELGAPYTLGDDRHVQIGASIGIALIPGHGREAERLLSRADMALYAAKAVGKGTYRTFSPGMEIRVQERVRLEAELRTALVECRDLFVFYQPIVCLRSGRVTAREALARWHHPQHGWVPPSEFIHVAEESGLIDRLGTFVLDQACREAAGWADGARVAVNISATQLGKGTLIPAILTALAGSGLPADRLEIEVTESALLSEAFDCIADLRHAREIGVRVALDDFGTGYSSLAHLRAFAFDKIKIDGTFVRDAVERPDCAAIVGLVADLGRRLGVTTVAEGVETAAHLQLVTVEGCFEAQGYLFSTPKPSERDAPLVAALEDRLEILNAAGTQTAIV